MGTVHGILRTFTLTVDTGLPERVAPVLLQGYILKLIILICLFLSLEWLCNSQEKGAFILSIRLVICGADNWSFAQLCRKWMCLCWGSPLSCASLASIGPWHSTRMRTSYPMCVLRDLSSMTLRQSCQVGNQPGDCLGWAAPAFLCSVANS